MKQQHKEGAEHMHCTTFKEGRINEVDAIV